MEKYFHFNLFIKLLNDSFIDRILLGPKKVQVKLNGEK